MLDDGTDPLAEFVIMITHGCHARKAVMPGKIDVYVNLFFYFITIVCSAKTTLYRQLFRLRHKNSLSIKKFIALCRKRGTNP